MDNITTYRGETKTISVEIPEGYTSGYTMNFILNDKEYSDDDPVLVITGLTITDDISLVNITATENDIPEMVYFFQCDIINGNLKYTIAKGSYTVIPSIS
jgi:hypothetical protein